MPDTLILEVVTPERRVVRDSVASVQVPGLTGYLGILPGHTPLLTELGIGALSYEKGGQTVYIAIFGGLAEVLSGQVTVLADDAERAEEVDAGKAQAALAEAEKKLNTTHEPDTDWGALLTEVARERARVEVAGHGAAVHK